MSKNESPEGGRNASVDSKFQCVQFSFRGFHFLEMWKWPLSFDEDPNFPPFSVCFDMGFGHLQSLRGFSDTSPGVGINNIL